MMLTLTLLLYALPHNIQFVANTLEAALIYLEHPITYNPADHDGYRYSNPHNPAPGVSGRGDAERRRARMASGLMGDAVGAGSATRVPKSVEVQRDQVNKVFDNLKSGVDLDECEPRESLSRFESNMC